MKNQRNRKSLSELIKQELKNAEEEGVQFMTFNVATEDRSMTAGRIVVAYFFPFCNEEALLINFAFCSPRDTFDRKYGQFIAYRRLMKPDGPIFVETPKRIIRAMAAISLIKEAHRREVPWMRTVQVKDLR